MFARILAYVHRQSPKIGRVATKNTFKRKALTFSVPGASSSSILTRSPNHATSLHSHRTISSLANLSINPAIHLQKNTPKNPQRVSSIILESQNKWKRNFSASMASEDFLTASSGAYVEKMYKAWKENPSSVDSSWSTYFMSGHAYSPKDSGGTIVGGSSQPISGGSFDLRSSSVAQKAVNDAVNLMNLAKAYQHTGHFMATLDPLKILDQGVDRKQFVPELLNINHWGFTEADLDRPIYIGEHTKFQKLMKSGDGWVTLRGVVDRLKSVYCGTIGYQYMHIANFPKNDFVRSMIESDDWTMSKAEKIRVLDRLIWATQFEDFLDIKYPAQKRFGVIGAESLIPLLKEVIDEGARHGINDFVIGMPHRGRLITMSSVMRKSLTRIFHEFRGLALPFSEVGDSGDVKYHLGFSNDRYTPDEHSVHLSLMPNPSHLEAVNASVMGKVRAKQFYKQDTQRKKTCAILIHGDASFAGQGSVYESMALTDLPDYTTGGVIHLVVNNQIGFTTDTYAARSSPYCTDVARSVASPIFHVNGDDPEAVVRCAKMAMRFRQKFSADTVVDMLCFRRYGHNEGDEPGFTQPLMYKVIDEKMDTKNTVMRLYKDKLVSEGTITESEFQAMFDRIDGKIKRDFDAPISEDDASHKPDYLGMNWERVSSNQSQKTSIDKSVLNEIAEALSPTKVPDGFVVHKNLYKILAKRTDSVVKKGDGIEWGTAEALAYGSLLKEGIHVRLSGQDSERGTFSHRHAVLHDQSNTDKSVRPRYIPLSKENLPGSQAEFHVMNSNLSELAVLGFEYGYAVEHPDALVLWEAQFGDFANGAQVVFDQFLSSAETKWMRQCGLVCLLPHGYEGGGPEHSSARMERYLQMSSDDCDEFSLDMDSQLRAINWQIVNCASPSNFFHVLRRQIHRNFRKPLIAFTPKTGLRHKIATAKIDEFIGDSQFRCVIGEESSGMVENAKIRKIVFVSGKLWIQLAEHRMNQSKQKNGFGNDIALVRIEQICPFPYADVSEQLKKYPNAKDIVWAQEEPKNMGAHDYVRPRIGTTLREIGDTRKLSVVSRDSSASPATGYPQIHAHEQMSLIENVFS